MTTDFRTLVPRMDFGWCFLVKHLPSSIVLAVSFVFLSNVGLANGSITCIGKVNVVLSGQGVAPVSPNMFVLDKPTQNMAITYHGKYITEVDCQHAGKSIDVMIIDTSISPPLTCWSTLVVENKHTLEVECTVEDTTILCLTHPDSINPFDLVEFTSNCYEDEDIQFVTKYDEIVDTFPYTSDTLKLIHRTLSFRDPAGNTADCQTTIVVERIIFDSIQIPPNITVICPMDPKDLDITGHLTYSNQQLLDLCKVSYSTQIVDSVPQFCDSKVKYFREWFLIDWTTMEMHRDTQVILLTDTVPASLYLPDSIVTFTNDTTCEFFVVLDYPNIHEGCTSVSEDKLTVMVDSVLHAFGDTVLLKKGSHVIQYGGQDHCGNDVIGITDTIEVDSVFVPILVCPPAIHSVAVGISQGESVMVRVDSLFPSDFDYKCGPISIYGRKLSVTCDPSDTVFSKLITFCLDECEDEVMVEIIAKNDSTGMYSTNTCMVMVQVQEQIPPQLECRDSVIVLGADTMATIDTMVLLSLLTDKSGIGSLTFTGSGTMAGSGIQFASNGDGTFGKFDCSLLDTFQVTIVATDINGNHDSCVAELIVIDTLNLCPAPFTFQGSIVVDNYMGLRHADIDLSNESSAYFSNTDIQGRFEFGADIARNNLRLAVDYSDEWINGITANDLYHLQNHITGYRPIAEDHFLMSSDVNADGEIDLMDLLELKKVLLGITSRMTSEVNPWLYMSTSDLVKDKFANHSNEFVLNPLQDGPNFLEILATKRGDLDGDIVDLVETRSVDNLSITLDKSELKAGETSLMKIALKDDIAAMQVELHIPNVEIQKVTGSDIEIFSDNNNHRLLYYRNPSKAIEDHIELVLRAHTAINLEHKMILNDQFENLRFNSEGERSRLTLDLLDLDDSGRLSREGMALIPNPSNGVFNIELAPSIFENKESTTEIIIMDVVGLEIFNTSWSPSELQEIMPIRLNSSLPSGVYTVLLRQGDKTLINRLYKL